MRQVAEADTLQEKAAAKAKALEAKRVADNLEAEEAMKNQQIEQAMESQTSAEQAAAKAAEYEAEAIKGELEKQEELGHKIPIADRIAARKEIKRKEAEAQALKSAAATAEFAKQQALESGMDTSHHEMTKAAI